MERPDRDRRRITLGVDQLGVPRYPRLPTRRRRRQRGDERCVEAGGRRTEGGVDIGRAAHDGVGTAVGVRDQAIEGVAERGGEDEGAGHEGDTEHHGYGRGDETQLLGGDLLECEAEHGSVALL